MNNFSFSHSVFIKLVSQGRQKVSLCGNGLMFVTRLVITIEKIKIKCLVFAFNYGVSVI